MKAVENNERRNGVCDSTVPTECVIECLETLETIREYWVGAECVIREWAKKFSASTIDGNTMGKIFSLSWYICHKHPCEIYKSFYQVVCFIQLSAAGVLSVSLKMDKIEYRAVLKLFVKEGLTINEIHLKFINVYGDSSPSFSTFKKSAAEFKRGRTSLEDDPREGRPKNATTPEIIEQVHDMILDDRRMKLREIAETIGYFKRTCRIYFA
jgi:transposase